MFSAASCFATIRSPTLIISRMKSRSYQKTNWGPNLWFRRGTFFIGTNPNPLKYFSTPDKSPNQSYGLQGTNHLLPGTGKIAKQKPIKMLMKKDKVYSWCACGHSRNQPLCDGSHNREETTLKPVRYIPEKDTEAWLCCCKQTKNRPFCDGTHETLPPPVTAPPPTGRG